MQHGVWVWRGVKVCFNVRLQSRDIHKAGLPFAIADVHSPVSLDKHRDAAQRSVSLAGFAWNVHK